MRPAETNEKHSSKIKLFPNPIDKEICTQYEMPGCGVKKKMISFSHGFDQGALEVQRLSLSL